MEGYSYATPWSEFRVAQATQLLQDNFFDGSYPAGIVFWIDPFIQGGIPLFAVIPVISKSRQINK
jgi:hypothetical protein